MKRIKTLYLCLAVVYLLSSPWARGQEAAEHAPFTTIDVPGAIATLAIDINSAGEIVGRYRITDGNHTRGFLRSRNGELTAIDFPGAVFTVAAGINRGGDIVGMYSLPGDPPNTRHGFLRRNGEFTTLDPPGSTFTNVLGINSRGEIVGRWHTGTGPVHGFLFSGGEFTTIDFPGASETDAWKINPGGEIVGGHRGADGADHVFLLSQGEFTTIDLPSAILPTLDNGGINPRGDIVSVYCDTAPCTLFSSDGHGFLLSRGAFTKIDVPGALSTQVLAINALGDIVGSYFDVSGKKHGVLLSK